MRVRHAKVSTLPDSSDPQQIQPSDWNTDHQIEGVLSTDPGNRASAGTDAGIYVPEWAGTDPLAYYILAKS